MSGSTATALHALRSARLSARTCRSFDASGAGKCRCYKRSCGRVGSGAQGVQRSAWCHGEAVLRYTRRARATRYGLAAARAQQLRGGATRRSKGARRRHPPAAAQPALRTALAAPDALASAPIRQSSVGCGRRALQAGRLRGGWVRRTHQPLFKQSAGQQRQASAPRRAARLATRAARTHQAERAWTQLRAAGSSSWRRAPVARSGLALLVRTLLARGWICTCAAQRSCVRRVLGARSARGCVPPCGGPRSSARASRVPTALPHAPTHSQLPMTCRARSSRPPRGR